VGRAGNHSNSVISAGFSHSGNASLHIIATGNGLPPPPFGSSSLVHQQHDLHSELLVAAQYQRHQL